MPWSKGIINKWAIDLSSTDNTSIYPTFDKKLTEKTLKSLFIPDAIDPAFTGIQTPGVFRVVWQSSQPI